VVELILELLLVVVLEVFIEALLLVVSLELEELTPILELLILDGLLLFEEQPETNKRINNNKLTFFI
jgi:hypothetical protein